MRSLEEAGEWRVGRAPQVKVEKLWRGLVAGPIAWNATWGD